MLRRSSFGLFGKSEFSIDNMKQIEGIAATQRVAEEIANIFFKLALFFLHDVLFFCLLYNTKKSIVNTKDRQINHKSHRLFGKMGIKVKNLAVPTGIEPVFSE